MSLVGVAPNRQERAEYILIVSHPEGQEEEVDGTIKEEAMSRRRLLCLLPNKYEVALKVGTSR